MKQPCDGTWTFQHRNRTGAENYFFVGAGALEVEGADLDGAGAGVDGAALDLAGISLRWNLVAIGAKSGWLRPYSRSLTRKS